MQSLTLEQAILETARSLSLDKQQTLKKFSRVDSLQIEDWEVEA